jgi:glutathione S-transferase
VQIPLDADGTEYTYRNVDQSDPSVMEELKSLWPIGLFPLLVDDGQVVPETTCIIEHLQRHHPGPNVWFPEGDEGLRARFLDRFFDLHIQAQFMPAVTNGFRPAADQDPYGERTGRAKLKIAYDWLEANLPDSEWGASHRFTIADCSAAPALFYADWIEEIGPERPRLQAYRARLLAHPSVAKAVDGGRPYRHYFPLGAPDRD